MHNSQFPETWYIQVDGGAENANKYLLACLEYLVIKRMVRKIVLTRLPVGHTHEVIRKLVMRYRRIYLIYVYFDSYN